jgi:alpha-L-arabinofuranosidase
MRRKNIAAAVAATAMTTVISVAVSAGTASAGSVAGSPVSATARVAASVATSPVTVHVGQTVSVLGRAGLGVDTPPWNDNLANRAAPGLMRAAGVQELEFNGGPMSDLYHWRTGSLDPLAAAYGDSELTPKFSFDRWAKLADSQHDAMFVHVNYGTGTPREAAAWVRYANRSRHYGVRNWEIGEEVYLDGPLGVDVEPDGHPAAQHTAQGFAHNALAYIKAMKAADPSIRIGIPILAVADPANPVYQWDATVLQALAPHVDFVDVHWYPLFQPGTDAQVLATPSQIRPQLAGLRQLIAQSADGRHVAVHVGETNSAVAGSPQTSSMTNALYLAETVPALLENKAEAVDWWALYNGQQGDASTGVGDLGLLSSGSDDCVSGSLCAPPVNAPYPDYYGMRLVSALTAAGSRLLATDAASTAVNAHAALRPDGSLAVLLVNTDPAKAQRVTLSLGGYRARPRAAVLSYGQHSSKISTSHAPVTGAVTLPPYSLTELILRRAG